MPSSKCGGFIASRKKRRKTASPRIAPGIQSGPASASCQCSRELRSLATTEEDSTGALLSALLVRAAMRILVTGGCGFIGSHFIRYILQHYKPAYVTNADVLTYAGNLANLDGVVEEHGERYEFFKADIANADQMDALMTEHRFYAVINF